jgi:hypothetical protein
MEIEVLDAAIERQGIFSRVVYRKDGQLVSASEWTDKYHICVTQDEVCIRCGKIWP